MNHNQGSHGGAKPIQGNYLLVCTLLWHYSTYSRVVGTRDITRHMTRQSCAGARRNFRSGKLPENDRLIETRSRRFRLFKNGTVPQYEPAAPGVWYLIPPPAFNTTAVRRARVISTNLNYTPRSTFDRLLSLSLESRGPICPKG